MTIFSLYIFDRHCDCVYYQDWHRTRPIRVPSELNNKPGVHRISTRSTNSIAVRESIFSTGSSESQTQSLSRVNGDLRASVVNPSSAPQKGLPFDEEAKLVYGVVLSLRQLVKQLSGKEEAFTSYKTPQYKLHLYETLTGYRFILLSDPSSDSLRFVLRQLYTGPFVDYVVRNPLVDVDSRTTGIDNDQFRTAVDRHMRGLSMFGT